MATTYGKSGVGRLGIDRRRTRARSTPTGWETIQGEVTGQELEFENGYRVLSVTIPGLKATIKGLDAWAAFLKHWAQVSAVVQEWITSEEKNHKGRSVEGEGAEPAGRMEALEQKVNTLTSNLDRLIEAISQKM